MYIHKNPAHAPLTSPPSLSGRAGEGGIAAKPATLYILLYIILFSVFGCKVTKKYKSAQSFRL